MATSFMFVHLRFGLYLLNVYVRAIRTMKMGEKPCYEIGIEIQIKANKLGCDTICSIPNTIQYIMGVCT